MERPARMDPKVWAHRLYRAAHPELAALRDAEGRRFCWWCMSEPVVPPRRTFCGDACVEDFRIRKWPHYARKRVWRRDHGVCATCGVSCAEPRYGATCGWAYHLFRHAWDADHRVPIALGGESTLGNLVTICRPCHKAKTAQQAREAAFFR